MERGMERWKPAHIRHPVRQQWLEVIATQVTLAALVAAAAAPIALVASLVPRAQVLPVLCLLALAGAALVALAAWCRSARRDGDRITDHITDHITSWDVAGALALVGFAAGMLSEPHSVLALFEQEAMTN
jgi:hypothetical protein